MNTSWRRRGVTVIWRRVTVTNVPTSVMKQTAGQSESKLTTQTMGDGYAAEQGSERIQLSLKSGLELVLGLGQS